MARYYVNKKSQANNDHELHQEDCKYMPNLSNRVYLGEYSSCHTAILAAKNKGYYSVDGCFHCSRDCHTS